jgi:hypothetical protein
MEDIPMKKAMLLLAIFELAGSLWAADPFVGIWKLNLAKSRFEGQAPKSETMKIEALGNGLKWTSEIVNTDGTTAGGGWSGKYDGKDYALTESADYDAIAATKINSNTFESVLKKGGRKVGTGRGIVSKDGKTLTLTSKLKNAQGQDVTDVSVFDKQ